MPASTDPSALAALRRDGVLLESDPRLPSVAGLVAGAPVRGSWWGHPAGGAIFRATNELADRADVVLIRLISGKVTFVHQRWWPHLLAIGSAGERWQMDGLSPAARALLRVVGERAEVRTDDPAVFRIVAPGKPKDAALELERRLLVAGRQVHTETGAHAKRLEAWRRWARHTGVRRTIGVRAAKGELDALLRELNQRFGGRGRLPWWE